MTLPMKPSKHVEGSISENCLDRISSLPDDLLGHVLSFLPTKLAVSTSILSTRWRYLFTLMTCLSFEDEIFKEQGERIEAARKFKEFIDKVLELHKISPIKKFSLVCTGAYDNIDLNRWVSNALKKGVQELHYELAGFINIDCVPDDFFMCETLVGLNFKGKAYYGHNRIKIPLSPRLPNLKILHLGSIMFVDFNSIERLFCGCELLQKLTFEYCGCYTDGHATYRTALLKVLTIRHCSFDRGTFEIDAPNLEYLKYSLNTGVKIVPSWKNSCSAYDDFDINIGLPKYEYELLTTAAAKASQLRFKRQTLELLFKLVEDEHMPEFPSLSSVQVRLYPYYVRECATRLIDKSPQLETVVFESCFLDCPNCSEYDTSEDCCCECGSELPSDIPQVPFSCHVQVIEVHKFCGHGSASRSLMEHLLTNASRLKTLIVHILSGCDLERDLEISKYLMMLPRASNDCHVEIKFGSGSTTLTSIPGQR